MTLPKLRTISWTGERSHCQEMTLEITIATRKLSTQVICISISERKVIWHGAFGGTLPTPEFTIYPDEKHMVRGIARWVLDVMDSCET